MTTTVAAAGGSLVAGRASDVGSRWPSTTFDVNLSLVQCLLARVHPDVT